MVAGGAAARPQLMRAMNEQLLLAHIRAAGEVARTDLARISGLAKNTVSQALATLERAGLVRSSGVRTGMPGPQAVLYEINPEAGFVLGLDVGSHYLRGAIADLTGAVRVRTTLRATAENGPGQIAELAELAGMLCAEAGIRLADVGQTVLGSPGIYDAERDALKLVGGRTGWDEPMIMQKLRATFGDHLVMENDIDAAALAERAHGHGREVDSFAFVSVGTGIGMGLVIGGKLHRGAHGAAGEIGFLPLGAGSAADAEDARRRGRLEVAASATGVVAAAQRAGLNDADSARAVFAAAGRGDAQAIDVVKTEAILVADAICAIVAVADPDLVVLGGGIGQAEKFLDQVAEHVHANAPVRPDLRVSALGDDAVVDGCLAAGADLLWQRLTEKMTP